LKFINALRVHSLLSGHRRDPVAPAFCLHYCSGKIKQPNPPRRNAMAWTTPTLVEICIGLEINGYLPAEF
jgi:coenzyme PQQ precursor peptide PqqA